MVGVLNGLFFCTFTQRNVLVKEHCLRYFFCTIFLTVSVTLCSNDLVRLSVLQYVTVPSGYVSTYFKCET